MSLRDALQIGEAWLSARWLDRLRDRRALDRHQARRTTALLAHVSARAPYYHAYRDRPIDAWPVIGKSEWMAQFDAINTVGAKLGPLMEQALDDERTRRFDRKPAGYSVGLSTGTSGARGLFIASRAERNRWAGTIIAKVIREPWRQQRIALLLRAGNSLYERVAAGPLTFRYFDLARPWDEVTRTLTEFDPTIVVAPAQALLLLAGDRRRPQPERLVSCAEVLHDFDARKISEAFGRRVEQIYQATEGFLGATCAAGTLHLNEGQYLIEREPLDGNPDRFIPIVTDLYRFTQPVIRYRLNDLLTVSAAPCPCGSVNTAIAAIDGRADDLLRLDSAKHRGAVVVFPDLVTRAIVSGAPGLGDFEVQELARGRWRIDVEPFPDFITRLAVLESLCRMTDNLGASPPDVEFARLPRRDPTRKMRRVKAATC